VNPIPIAIPLLPLAAFAILVVFGSRLGRAAAYVAIAAIGASAALSVYVLSWTFGGVALDQSLRWFEIGSVAADFGIRIDALSGLMLLVVTAVSLLVHVYSIGYMGGEARYSVYFAYLSLFSAAMLMLVAVDNFLLLYICWELVGLCSFLLIGYYVDRPAAGDAAKKAFITTRIGDLGLLVAILAIYASVGSFRYSEVFAAAAQGKLGAPAALAADIIFSIDSVETPSASVRRLSHSRATRRANSSQSRRKMHERMAMAICLMSFMPLVVTGFRSI